jgi:hypothetical protein
MGDKAVVVEPAELEHLEKIVAQLSEPERQVGRRGGPPAV